MKSNTNIPNVTSSLDVVDNYPACSIPCYNCKSETKLAQVKREGHNFGQWYYMCPKESCSKRTFKWATALYELRDTNKNINNNIH